MIGFLFFFLSFLSAVGSLLLLCNTELLGLQLALAISTVGCTVLAASWAEEGERKQRERRVGRSAKGVRGDNET